VKKTASSNYQFKSNENKHLYTFNYMIEEVIGSAKQELMKVKLGNLEGRATLTRAEAKLDKGIKFLADR